MESTEYSGIDASHRHKVASWLTFQINISIQKLCLNCTHTQSLTPTHALSVYLSEQQSLTVSQSQSVSHASESQPHEGYLEIAVLIVLSTYTVYKRYGYFRNTICVVGGQSQSDV